MEKRKESPEGWVSACIPPICALALPALGTAGAQGLLGGGLTLGTMVSTAVHSLAFPDQGIPEARPPSPSSFCFCASGFMCAWAWNPSWGFWGTLCLGHYSYRARPGKSPSPTTTAGGGGEQAGGLSSGEAGGAPTSSDSQNVGSSPPRPLPGAFFLPPTSHGSWFQSLVSSLQGPWGGWEPHFAVEETEAQGG